jgi:predicted XRE-type DNA-binding protein
MHAKTSKPAHVSTDATLFEDLGFSREQAAVLELKLALHNELMKVVAEQQLTPRQLEKLLDIPQPRVSELLTGKLSHMTADRLTKYLHRLGRQVNVSTTKAALHGTEVA